MPPQLSRAVAGAVLSTLYAAGWHLVSSRVPEPYMVTSGGARVPYCCVLGVPCCVKLLWVLFISEQSLISHCIRYAG